MTTPVRPFDLPLPPGTATRVPLGLVDAPSPAIGRILFATSSIDPAGYGLGDGNRKTGPVGRVAFATFLGILGLAFVGAPIAFVIGSMLPYETAKDLPGIVLWVPALVPAVLAFLVTWKKFGRGKRVGTVWYVGEEGVDKVDYDRGSTTRTTVRFDALSFVWRRNSRTVNQHGMAHTSESVALGTGEKASFLMHGFYLGTVGDGDPDVGCVREVARRATEHVYRDKHARLARGEAVTFTITGGPSKGAVVLQGDHVELPGGRRLPRAQVSARFQQGFVEIDPGDPAVAGMSIDMDHLVNADVLVRLLRG